MSVDTLSFQAEAKQLLHLMIHSLYSNKEIFLRELISNASDAADKLRFEALEKSELYENDAELRVRIDLDAEAGTITVTDNGIGMSREEAIENLGTIAKSGTSQFLKGLTGDQQKDAHLIGQFGVGFYSAFIVADKVTVETRRAGLPAAEGVRWSCEGEADFTVETVDIAERGTRVTLHLREDDKEFANEWRLRSIVTKYSDHIAVPVQMKKSAPPVAEDEGEDVTEIPEYEVVNSATALWTRPKSEISDEEYQSFYQHVSHDFKEPLSWSHNRVEGKLDYTSLLYIPAHAPFDLYNRETPRGLKLYIQRTFIMDNAEQFLPLYLRFIKGVVDSNDLPLNVSREILQSSPAVDSIRSALVKRVLSELEKLAKTSPDDYAAFWKEFGPAMKEGIAEDFANKDRVAGLLRFHSTQNNNTEQTVSLADYVGRMKEKQEKIYYLLGENINAARNSAYLEAFAKQDIEVLLLADRIDEWMMSYLTEFEGKNFQNISKGELDKELFDDQTGEQQDAGQDSPELISRIKEVLGEKVEDVRSTRRLTESPACLVYGDQDMGAQMRQILEAAGQQVPDSKAVLEVNLGHPLLNKLDGEADEEKASELVALLYDQAVLAAGEQLDNPAEFVKRLNKLLVV